MDKAYYAKEAERLSKETVLLEAVDRIRSRALEALVRADPNIATDVARLQAKVVVCNEFMSELKSMVSQGDVKARPTIV